MLTMGEATEGRDGAVRRRQSNGLITGRCSRGGVGIAATPVESGAPSSSCNTTPRKRSHAHDNTKSSQHRSTLSLLHSSVVTAAPVSHSAGLAPNRQGNACKPSSVTSVSSHDVSDGPIPPTTPRIKLPTPAQKRQARMSQNSLWAMHNHTILPGCFHNSERQVTVGSVSGNRSPKSSLSRGSVYASGRTLHAPTQGDVPLASIT